MSARTKIAMIKPINQTTLFPVLSGGNVDVGGAAELPSVVTPPPLCVGGVEDSGGGTPVVSATFPPIPLPERNRANSHHAILPLRTPFGADLCPIAGFGCP